MKPYRREREIQNVHYIFSSSHIVYFVTRCDSINGEKAIRRASAL